MLNLHPLHVAAAYEFLRALPPFNQWHLPPGDEVHFKVSATKDRQASHRYLNHEIHENTTKAETGHHIQVSSYYSRHLNTLLMNMAHEMVHQYQVMSKTETPHTEHNAEFNRLGELICKRYGWDAGQF